MFALLPAFAALLKVVYLGRSRRYPSRPRLYGEHLVFAAHNHAFLFVVGSLMGIFIGSSRLVYAGFYPLLIGINSVPKAASGSRRSLKVRSQDGSSFMYAVPVTSRPTCSLNQNAWPSRPASRTGRATS